MDKAQHVIVFDPHGAQYWYYVEVYYYCYFSLYSPIVGRGVSSLFHCYSVIPSLLSVYFLCLPVFCDNVKLVSRSFWYFVETHRYVIMKYYVLIGFRATIYDSSSLSRQH